ncbi:MAG: hypothetical protein PHV20_08470 [Bacteroidales bacterium]|nr:hypothetical protein [Bacteroidales bacterium]
MKTIFRKIIFILLGAIYILNFSSCTVKDDVTLIVPKTLSEYKQQQKEFVDAQLAVVYSCVVGYNKGDFKSNTTFDSYKSDYLTVLKADSAIIYKADVTIEELVAGNKSITTAGKAFNGSLWLSDRRPLNDVIVAADALNSATVEGSAVGQVSTEAKTTFTNAITAAKAIRGASATVDRQVADAVIVLTAAQKAFNDAIIK